MARSWKGCGFLALTLLFLGALPATTVPAQGPVQPVRLEVHNLDPAAGEDPLEPDMEIRRVPFEVAVIVPPGHVCTSVVTLNYHATGPSYATVFLNPSAFTFTFESNNVPYASGTEATMRTNTLLVVGVTREAPALVFGEYEVTATMSADGTTCDWTPTSTSIVVEIRNDYFPLIEPIAQRSLVKVGQGDVAIFPVDVTNRGNGPTNVTATATVSSRKAPSGITLPPPTILPSRATDGASAETRATLVIEVRVEESAGYTNGVYSFQVDFVGAYGGNLTSPAPLLTYTKEVSLALQVQGVSAPGVDAAWIVLVAVAIVAVRRVREC